jgi:type II secretory pathway pseudopilin PulG
MLVVIGIIVVLMAILFPVFSIARKRARKTQCEGQLHQIALALKAYKDNYSGHYPPPVVFVNGRYEGGLSALYPDFIDNQDILVCPEDAAVKGAQAQAKQVRYSSYNGKATNPRGGNWALTEAWYNFFGYTFSGAPGGPITSTGVDNGGMNEAGYLAAVLPALQAEGKRKRDLPRLWNRAAPDTTIVTHCPYHSSDAEVVLRLGGDVDGNAKRSFLQEDPDGAGVKVAPYLSQLK